MSGQIPEAIPRLEVIQRICSLEREASGNSETTSGPESVFDAAAIILLEERVGDMILEQHPWCHRPKPEAIAQTGRPSWRQMIETVELSPDLLPQVDGKT